MDDSLASLLASLQTTQQAKSTTRLSDRTVVELVNKLKQLGILGDDLLHTINGKEYITTDRLRREIQTALAQAGGRLSLVELPALVGVDLVHCEVQAASIVAASNGSIIEAQGELLTIKYFDSIAVEINDLLQESGMVSVSDLAVQYSLNTELLISTISARIGSFINGRLETGLLYTPAYLRNVKAQLRGALRASSSPLLVPTLIKDLGLEGVTFGSGGVISSLIEELVSEGAVKGTLKGGGINWLPSIYASAQQSAVSSFYTQNGWVGYDTVRKMGIANEKTYLRTTFPEGVALDTAFVGPSVLAQLDATVEEAISAGSWVDVSPLLPSVLTEADAATLLANVDVLQHAIKSSAAGKKASSSAQVLAGTCVVSQQLLQALQDKVDAAARAAAEKALAERKASSAAAGPHASAAQQGAQAAAAGGKKGAAAAADDEDDEDWSMGSSKKKKGAKGGGGAKGKAAAGCPAPAAKGNNKAGAAGVGYTIAQVRAQVVELQPEMDGAGEGADLAKAIAQVLLPGAVVAYEQALQAAFTAGAEERRRHKEALNKAFEEAYTRLVLYSHGAEVFVDDESTYTTLQRHIVRTAGSECVDLLFKFCKVDHLPEDQQQQGAASTDILRTPMSAAERSQVQCAVPPDVAAGLSHAAEIATSSSMKDVEAMLEKAANEVGLRSRKLDKKAEKSAVLATRQRLLEALSQEQEPAATLALVVPLLFIKATGKAISLPGKAIGGVLSKLKGQLPEETISVVDEFYTLVVDYLKQQGTAQGAVQREQLTEKLPTVMAAAGISTASSAAAAPSSGAAAGSGSAGSGSVAAES